MAKSELPSFLSPATITETIAERELVFFPISAKVLFRLRPVAGHVAKVIEAYQSGQPYDVRQKALAELLDVIGQQGELACTLILDALRDEEWARPVTAQAASALFERIDGPTLAAMLAAVARVNAEAFRPLLQGLRGADAPQADQPPDEGTAGPS